MAWLVRRGGHIRIDIVTSHMPPARRARLLVATSLLAAAVCAFIAYWGVVTTYDFYVRGLQSEKVLTIPMWMLLGCIPLGFGLTAVEFVRVAICGEEAKKEAP
jgi:TRAP-type C4-dicarboxylate transport system permease small subunit